MTDGIIGAYVIIQRHSSMHALVRLPALIVLSGTALLTASCHYFQEESATKLYNQAIKLGNQNQMAEALATYDKLFNTYKDQADNPEILKVLCSGLNNQAILTQEHLSWQQTIPITDRLVATCSADSRPEMRHIVALALFNQSVRLRREQHQTDQAIAVLRQLINTYAADTDPDTRATVAGGLLNLAVYLADQDGHMPEVMGLLQRLITTYATDTAADVREQRAKALYALGSVQLKSQQPEQALATWQQLIDTYSPGDTAGLHNYVSKGLSDQAELYGNFGKYAEALANYTRLIKTYAQDKDPKITEKLPYWQYMQANLQQKTGQYHEAAVNYTNLIKTYSESPSPTVRPIVAESSLQLADICLQQHQADKANHIFDAIIQIFSQDTAPEIRWRVARAWQNKGVSQQDTHPTDAIAAFEQVVHLYGQDTDKDISWVVAFSLNAEAYSRLLMAKRMWHNRSGAHTELQTALAELNAALERTPTRSWTLGNLAYVQWLLGDRKGAMASFAKGLSDPENGGATLYKDTINDIARFPIPEDLGFRSMVNQQWVLYGTSHGSHT